MKALFERNRPKNPAKPELLAVENISKLSFFSVKIL